AVKLPNIVDVVAYGLARIVDAECKDIDDGVVVGDIPEFVEASVNFPEGMGCAVGGEVITDRDTGIVDVLGERPRRGCWIREVGAQGSCKRPDPSEDC